MGDTWSSFRRRRSLAVLKTALTQAAVLVAGAVAVGSFLAITQVLRATDEVEPTAPLEINAELAALEQRTQEAYGALEVTKLQLERATNIIRYSTRYRIPADLTAMIYDIAVAEGIHPSLGFQLVRVESNFEQRARSHKSAIGYTQLRLATARGYQPDLTERDLEQPETNLRIGFRYLRDLLKRFDGDLDLALVAYNRGPTLVDSLLTAGDDPANGYSNVVRRGLSKAAAASPTSGS